MEEGDGLLGEVVLGEGDVLLGEVVLGEGLLCVVVLFMVLLVVLAL